VKVAVFAPIAVKVGVIEIVGVAVFWVPEAVGVKVLLLPGVGVLVAAEEEMVAVGTLFELPQARGMTIAEQSRKSPRTNFII
jgi:hypothetical protein